MVRERRLSSDGLKLFNMAYTQPPKKTKIKKLLHCFFYTEYDDRLDEMLQQCRVASQQLLSYTHHKDLNVNKLINNSIFNLIHAMLIEDGTLLSKFRVRQNYRYYFDLVEKLMESNDHHNAIIILCALKHHSIAQLRFKKRKKDVELLQLCEDKYGTFKNCYKNHLKEAMENTDYENYLPCLMVLNMHFERHRAFATIGNCRLKYDPQHIKAQIGLHAMHHNYPGEIMSLFNQPECNSNSELILLAQSIKK